MTTSTPHRTLVLRGRVYDVTHHPLVMGILNHTPDSFYSGSRIESDSALHRRVEQLLSEGADIIDVGGYSTRPHAAVIEPTEEWRRVSEALQVIRSYSTEIPVSVDTFRSSIARQSIESGDADVINDVSGGLLDSAMGQTIAELSVPYILMHMRGTPDTMQSLTQYSGRVADVVITELLQRITELKSDGVRDEQIILDPGFGFSKDMSQNWELMADLDKFGVLQYTLLVGISRKSMIYRLLGGTPADALNGTTFLHTYSLLHGAHILRAHDVAEARECVSMYLKLREQMSTTGALDLIGDGHTAEE